MRYGRKQGRRAKVVIPKKEAYLLRDRNAHIVDYKDFKENTLGSGDARKAYCHVNNDIGGRLNQTLRLWTAITYHLVVTYQLQ